MTAIELRRARIAAIRAEPSPIRRDLEHRARVRLLVGLGVAWLILLLAGGVHAASRPVRLLIASALSWGIIAVLATRVALHRGRFMLGLPRRWLLGAAIVVAPLLAVTWFSLPWPDLPPQPHLYAPDAVCFALTLAFATGPLLAFLGVHREGDPIQPTVTGAAMGAAAGAWGAMFVDLHCECTGPCHVVFGHLLPCAVLAVVGASWGRSALALTLDR